MKKPKRISLAVKVNIVIMAMVLSVSVMLILISENTYQKAVFRPYFRKLENVEISEDELKPTVQEMLPYLGTEELNQVISAEDEIDRNHALIDWFRDKPSLDGPPLSMFDDWYFFEVALLNLQIEYDEHEISCYAEKNGNRYRICTVRDDEYYQYNSTSFTEFGSRMPENAPAEKDYLSPKYLEADGKVLLLRFIPLSLEDGGQAWLRLSFDLTEELQEHRYFLIRSILLTIVVTLLASVVTALVMRRYVLQPVRTLAKETKEFVPEEDGTYSRERIGRVEIRSNDEIGDLSRDIRTMQESIVTNTENLARMTAERERTATELEMAAKIQADALPNIFPAFPEHSEFDIFAGMTPAKEVGGDFYDFFLIDETHLGIVMADVSDKGMPAALFMMSAKSLIRTYAGMKKSPAEVMQAVNDRLCENNRELMFVTVWFGILDLAAGRITAVNAGHELPALMPAGGRFDLIRERPELMVGARKKMRWRELEIDLTPGAKIFLYTDGVPDAHSPAGKMFGEERMIWALNEGCEKSPEELLRHMKKAVDAFVQDGAQFDDLTMLCLEYKGPTAS